MAIIKYKPTSPGRRFQSVSDFSEITSAESVKRLLKSLKRKGGRNSYGRITARHIGGGHKRKYRVIDFRRNKDGIPAKVASIEYDPNRTARIALLNYRDGEKRYIIAPGQVNVGDVLYSGEKADIKPGNAVPLKHIPPGSLIHNVELKVGRGGQLIRSAGAYGQPVSYTHLRAHETPEHLVCRLLLENKNYSHEEMTTDGNHQRRPSCRSTTR